MQVEQIRKFFYVLVILCTLMGTQAFGQPENPAVDPDTVPITGLELLLGAGALLGVKRLLGKKKENIQ